MTWSHGLEGNVRALSIEGELGTKWQARFPHYPEWTHNHRPLSPLRRKILMLCTCKEYGLFHVFLTSLWKSEQNGGKVEGKERAICESPPCPVRARPNSEERLADCPPHRALSSSGLLFERIYHNLTVSSLKSWASMLYSYAINTKLVCTSLGYNDGMGQTLPV